MASVDHPRYQVQAVLDFGRALLQEVSPVVLPDLVPAQSLCRLHGMRHGGQISGIDRIHLVDQREDSRQFLAQSRDLPGVERQPRQVRDMRQLLLGDSCGWNAR